MLLLVLLIVSNALAASFSPYLLTAFTKGFIMNGTYYQNLGNASVPSTYVVDSPNNRIALNISEFGYWVTLPNAVYVYNQEFNPGCFIMTGRNFATEYNGYQSAQTFLENIVLQTYFGMIDVADACGHEESFYAKTIANIPVDLAWSLDIPLEMENGTSVCYTYNSNIIFDVETFNDVDPRDGFFVLPPSCSTPIDYCSGAFPSGNVCEKCNNCVSNKRIPTLQK